MYIQVINFHLKGMTDAEYRALCDQLAPSIAQTPGMIAKVWLANPATNTYGGVITWRDRAAMEQFMGSDVFAAIAAHPNIDGVTSTDFGVLEEPTRITNGLAGVAA